MNGGKVKQIAEKVVPVYDFIKDECTAKHWSMRELACNMDGDTTTNMEALILVRDNPRIALDNWGSPPLDKPLAGLLADVFATSAQFWLDVDRQYQEAVANRG